MLEDIVEGEHEWVKNETSLSSLGGNPWVDSELEARFPEALARFSGTDAVGGQKVRVSQDVVRGKHGYRLIIGNLAYELEPQVDLGEKDGAQFASRPDFVLWPVRTGLKPAAIFLDGYQFHADKSSEDLIKRQSLMHAGFVVWTLNWYDINRVMGDKAMDVPLLSGMVSPEQNHAAITALATRAGVSNSAEHINKTSFDLLLHFLTEQDATALSLQALLFVVQCIPGKALADAALRQQVLDHLQGLPAAFTDQLPLDVALAGRAELHDQANGPLITLELVAGAELLKSVDLTQALVSICYDRAGSSEEAARYRWQRFWTAVNLLQFLPLFYGWTPESKCDGTAAGLLWPDTKVTEEATAPTPAWYDLLDADMAAELSQHAANWPCTPLVGDDVLDVDEAVIGTAEILFETEKIVFLLPDQLEIQARLEADGWTVCTRLAELVDAINTLDAGA
jgi:DEAD/DEAH box helicase domain-containing protein